MTITTKSFACLAAFAALAVSPFVARGQVQASSAPKLTPELKKQTIDSLLSAMRETYVDADVAKKAEANLLKQRDGKAYDGVEEGVDFARMLTQHLNEVCKDAHLNVRFSPNVLPARRENSRPSEEEIARMRESIRLSNAGFEEVRRLQGNIGYIKMNGFADVEEAKRPAKAAFEFLQNTDAIIFDMRDNGGGSPETVQLVCSYLFGEKVHLNSIYTRIENRTTDYYSLEKVDGPKYLGKDVYVIMGRRTGSAAEEFCYNLQTRKRATLIGDRTWGGANPGRVVRLNDHFSAFIPTGKAINPVTKTNWEGTGVQPDVKIDPADALKKAHTMAVEKLLQKASKPEDKERLSSVLKQLGA